MTASELAIVSALAAEAVEVLQRDVSLAVEIVEDRIQFLLDAELIEVDDVSDLVRKVLHLALDATLDEIADCDEEEECEDCDCSEEDEEEDERAY
jgi:predicted nucleic-acid-binding protein